MEIRPLGRRGLLATATEIEMNLLLILPPSSANSSGNLVTAKRWAEIITSFGHSVEISSNSSLSNSSCDIAIFLNAYKSKNLVQRLSADSKKPVIVIAITGTDLHSTDEKLGESLENLQKADFIVAINPHSLTLLPNSLQNKSVLIYQSANVSNKHRDIRPIVRKAVILSHIRREKNPLLVDEALDLLDESLPIEVNHFGAALDTQLSTLVGRASETNPRYKWHGEIDHHKALDELVESDLLIITSRVEGAPAVVSESVAAGIPILASNISTLVGLLGDEYPGYFEVDSASSLASQINRCVTDENFYRSLKASTAELKEKFAPSTERKSWARFLSDLEAAAFNKATA